MPFQLFKRHRQEVTKEEYLARLVRKGLNPDGTPILDPTPIAPPIGYKKTPSMVEIVRDMVRGEKLREAAQAAGMETFEESEDFDIPDDPVQLDSPWVNEFDPPIEELVKAGKEVFEQRKAEEEKSRLAKQGSLVDSPPPSKRPRKAVPPSDGQDDNPEE